MLSKEKILRINQLARKSKAEGLTAEEREEQARLRGEYLHAVRQSLRAQLDSITLVEVDEEGNELERRPLRSKSDRKIQ